MRILVLANVPPGNVGGAEVQASHLSHCWARHGNQVIVAGYANTPGESPNLIIHKLKTIRFNKSFRAVTYLISTLWFLFKNRSNYDVIYCRFLKEHAFAACLAKILFRLPQPIIACPASTSNKGDVAVITTSPFKYIWVGVLRKGISCINVMSKKIEEEVRLLGIKNIIIRHMPNGVVIPTISEEISHHDLNNELRLIFVGRLVEEKGVDILLESIHKLNISGSVIKLIIIGDGPQKPNLIDKVNSYKLNDIVSFYGELPNEVTAKYFEQSDIFILPSYFEGMSGALLEALSHGLPAIVTRVSGSEDIINRNIGWVVSVGDVSAMSFALSSALSMNRKSLHEMGVKAREISKREFDIEIVAEKYLQLFKMLVKV